MKTNVSKAITQLPVSFPLQSYFDSTFLQNAILNQAAGSPIVASTLQTAQNAGVGVALHPASAAPVAIRFRGGYADSASIILSPGQRLIVGSFESFEWGLPFGWLGGGTSLLYVLHRPDADVNFPPTDNMLVMFHRTRLVIEGPGFPGTVRANWPGSFPWPSAFLSDAVSTLLPQGGAPIVNIQPDYAFMRLRSSLGAPLTLTFVFRATDDLDIGAGGLVSTTTDLTAYDLTFPAVVGGSGTFPVNFLPKQIASLVGYQAAVAVIDPSNTIVGSFIDVLRYGSIM